jgi:hypothetical protein
LDVDAIETFGRLPIALALFRAQLSGPGTDSIGSKELEPIVLLHPQLKKRLFFEDADQHRVAGGQARLS